MNGFEIRNLIHEGGFIMYPLVICSVLATIVLVERGILLFGARKRGRKLAREVLGLVRCGELEAARKRCEKTSLPLGPVLAAGIDRAGTSLPAGPAVDRARAAAGLELKRGLWILGTIGASAPFVGLFGTVVGIIKSFHEIAKTGQGGFATVAAGISEALIATGAGIAVAVLAFAANNFFQVYVGNLSLEWKLAGEELTEALAARTASPEFEEAVHA
jgi:biopolymer transport protein ExbB